MAKSSKNSIPKTKPRIRLRKNSPQTTPGAERRAARKAAFLECAKQTFGNIDQAVAAFNDAAQGHDKLNKQTVYEWSKIDPDFSAALADCRHLIAEHIGTLAIKAVETGLRKANPAMTKLALDYYVMPEQRGDGVNGNVNVQVNVSLAEALHTGEPVQAEIVQTPKISPNSDLPREKISQNDENALKTGRPVSEVFANAE